jgi:hypothetical protein
VQYAWSGEGLENIEDWWVFVDPKVERSVGLSLAANLYPPIRPIPRPPPGFVLIPPPPWEYEDILRRLPYETTKGIRFGHSAETVSAVYGPPSKTYTFFYGRASFYYPDLRTEFEFVCRMNKLDRNTRCESPSLLIDRITIFAPGWSPETLWGQGGRR